MFNFANRSHLKMNLEIAIKVAQEKRPLLTLLKILVGQLCMVDAVTVDQFLSVAQRVTR